MVDESVKRSKTVHLQKNQRQQDAKHAEIMRKFD